MLDRLTAVTGRRDFLRLELDVARSSVHYVSQNQHALPDIRRPLPLQYSWIWSRRRDIVSTLRRPTLLISARHRKCYGAGAAEHRRRDARGRVAMHSHRAHHPFGAAIATRVGREHRRHRPTGRISEDVAAREPPPTPLPPPSPSRTVKQPSLPLLLKLPPPSL